jgi:lysophospholipase L1-like esterase
MKHIILQLILSITLLNLSYDIQAQQDTILIDFGNNRSAFPWNNIENTNNGAIRDLINSDGFNTGIQIEVSDAFNGINNSGTMEPSADLHIPATASGDSFFGNTVEFSNRTEPTGGVIISNLDITSTYTIEIFSSRVANDNRDTQYIITGSSTDTLTLGVSSNQSNISSFTTLPSSDGTLTLTASPGELNNNANGFFYLGVIRLSYEEVPIGPISLSLDIPNGGEFWQVNKSADISWTSQNIGLITLEYSVDNGDTWTMIDEVPAAPQKYNWQIPNDATTEALVRISSATEMDISDNTFEIADNDSRCGIVILGSSTAAGTGPSTQDSTWVNRYSNRLTNTDTRFEITNLARGGSNTFNIIPTGTVIDPSINVEIDTARNITKAISFDPYAIIVNMPSNDAANFFDAEQQLENFNTIINEAEANGIEVWICTTQPRNFNDDARLNIQQEVRDSILSIYKDRAINFWDGIADSEGRIIPAFDSGDGVHLNDAGHRILVDRIRTAEIDTLCGVSIISSINELDNGSLEVNAYYLSSNHTLHFEYNARINERIEYTLYDLQGRKLISKTKDITNNGQQNDTWQLDKLHASIPSLYIVNIKKHDGTSISNRSQIIFISN